MENFIGFTFIYAKNFPKHLSSHPNFKRLMSYTKQIATSLQINEKSVNTVLELLAEGASIPFIARYRKDKTNNLDEVQIEQIQQENKRLTDFFHRQEVILKSIEEQGKLTPELKAKILATTVLSELEDIYLPYKPKRRTRAQIAREHGLEPLALIISLQRSSHLIEEAKRFLHDKVLTTDDALQGARDIIAENISEDAIVRSKIRKRFEKFGLFKSKIVKGKEEEGNKYRDYFDFNEKLSSIPSHRIMAIIRGVMEGFLIMAIEPDMEEYCIEDIEKIYLKYGDEDCRQQMQKAIKDCYKRLLQPQFESESRMQLREKAENEAINVFAENLRQLLLSSPLGTLRILSIDPGIRTGCKVVCLDNSGALIDKTTIFLHGSKEQEQEAAHKIMSMVEKHCIEAFAIGDGTAGRDTERFIKGLQFSNKIPLFLVNEDGASIYSASEIARNEFPNEDITVRGAISIGRRLMDPLAELVKIDPKSIGVGQYQHDVNQFKLKEKLDQTVVSCVNAVGVNLNTASKQLLSYVSGIGPLLAENIIQYRDSNGRFKNRKQLKEVSRMGDKSYEQCAGFLRIKDGDSRLDASAVHPESYSIVEQMAKELKIKVEELIGKNELIQQINKQQYINENIGVHTLNDILNELKKPGLDPRSTAEVFEFSSEVYDINDVREGMILPGMVTNITRFGAFVDIGVKQDGLVHISHIANQFIKDPADVLKLQQKVMVKVLEVDIARKRINLSIKEAGVH